MRCLMVTYTTGVTSLHHQEDLPDVTRSSSRFNYAAEILAIQRFRRP